MKQKESTHARSLKLAGIFLLLLIGIICISLLVKTILLFSQSSFDGKHQYILFDIEKNATAKVVVFNPAIQSVTITSITNVYSEADIEKNLLLPYDASIHDPLLIINESTTALLARFFFHFHTFQPIDINPADVYKLWLYAKGIPNSSIQEQTLTFPLKVSRIDLTNNFYTDSTLFHEPKTITVVNATGLTGIGAIFANVITTIGGNVVSVTTADEESEKSVLYATSSTSYTVNRLSHLLHIPIVMKKQRFSDIIIIIGTDKSNLPYFSR